MVVVRLLFDRSGKGEIRFVLVLADGTVNVDPAAAIGIDAAYAAVDKFQGTAVAPAKIRIGENAFGHCPEKSSVIEFGLEKITVFRLNIQIGTAVELGGLSVAGVHDNAQGGAMEFRPGHGAIFKRGISRCETEGTAVQQAFLKTDIIHFGEIEPAPFERAPQESYIPQFGKLEIRTFQIDS